jgi:hypothetical protein
MGGILSFGRKKISIFNYQCFETAQKKFSYCKPLREMKCSQSRRNKKRKNYFMKKLYLLPLACLTLFTTGCSKNIMTEVSAPDAKLNDGKFAEKFPIHSDPEHIAIFHWTPIIWDIDFKKEKAIDAIKVYSDRPDHPMDAILVIGSLDNKNWFKITDLAAEKYQIKGENGRLTYADTKI